MKEKNRAKLFMMIERKIQKKAKACFEKEDVDEICDYSDEMIEATKNGESRDDRDCKEGLIILKDLIR